MWCFCGRSAPMPSAWRQNSQINLSLSPRSEFHKISYNCLYLSNSFYILLERFSIFREHNKEKKMQIRIKCKCGVDCCPEWAIVELQGVIEAQPSFQDCLQNLEIGQLCRPSYQESYTFTVGYHELTGSKEPLKKPFLVLKKAKSMDLDPSNQDNSAGTELEVVGIIRYRILFKTRPKALISKPQPVVKERASGAGSSVLI